MASLNRILGTPSPFARTHYLYVQEVGSLESREPHVSRRKNLASYLFVIVTKGSGIFTLEGRSVPVSAGSCLWIDCRKPYSHESSSDNPWTLMWVHFLGVQAESYYETFLSLTEDIAFTPASILPFTEIIRDIYDAMKSPGALTELGCNRLLTDLITMICEETASVHPAGDAISEKLLCVREYLDEHYSENIRLEDLEQKFFVTRFYLSREYKKQFGSTIGSDLTKKRITGAKFRLRYSSESIESIALSCGFKDAGYFIKVFKASEGMTPSAFRKSWLESQL